MNAYETHILDCAKQDRDSWARTIADSITTGEVPSEWLLEQYRAASKKVEALSGVPL